MAKQPNILILWGDDIGTWNISHFSRGMMGYRTPNIDRVATEGVTFTITTVSRVAPLDVSVHLRSEPASNRLDQSRDARRHRWAPSGRSDHR